jgi:mitochondrial import receptor subunit TOM22
MVEFEEIKDEHYEDDDGFVDEDDDDYSDTSSVHDNDDVDDSIDEETILDRIVALKDIIPLQQRLAVSRAISKTVSLGSMATFISGKAVYIAMTSILMVSIPYALALEEEKAISEQERQMQLQQGMSEVFSGCKYFLMGR